MTVLAYRDGVLAGDGRITDKWNIVSDDAVKVFKFQKYLLGVSGTWDNAMKLVELEQAGRNPGPLKGCSAIRIDRKGRIETYEGSHWYPINDKYMAQGVGYNIALTAMDLGADAVTAVKATIKRNNTCGGKIRKVSW